MTFINAHRALVRGDRVEDVHAWLHRIAHNAALGIRRERGFDDAPLEDLDDAVTEPVDHVVERRERLDEVVRALVALPDRQREALVLQALEGRSHEEIAARLVTSDGAVRQLLARGRSALRVGLTALIPFGLALRLGTRDASAAVGTTGPAGAGALLAKGLAIATVTVGVAAGVTVTHDHARSGPPRAAALAAGVPAAAVPRMLAAAAPAPAAGPKATAAATRRPAPRRSPVPHAHPKVRRTASDSRPVAAAAPATVPAPAPAASNPARGGRSGSSAGSPAARPAPTASPVAQGHTAPAPERETSVGTGQDAGDAGAGEDTQPAQDDAPGNPGSDHGGASGDVSGTPAAGTDDAGS